MKALGIASAMEVAIPRVRNMLHGGVAFHFSDSVTIFGMPSFPRLHGNAIMKESVVSEIQR